MHNTDTTWPSTRALTTWLVLVTLVMLVFNQSIPVWDQDEAAYAGMSMAMERSGNWVEPSFLWCNMHRKPPLLFWLMASSYKLFGVNEFATRLPGVLSVLLTLLAVSTLGARLFSVATARLAAILLGTTPFVPLLGKMALTDAPLLLCETVALLSLGNVLVGPMRRHVVLFWLAVAAGLLAKGPPVLVVSGGAFAFALVFHPSRRNLIALHPWFFGPLALLPLVGWGWLAWQLDNGEFIRWMLDWYVFKRARESVLGQEGPPGYYTATFLLTLFPWIALGPAAILRLVRNLRQREPHAIFLLGWLASGWLLYEVARSKLPTYALGAYPALALALAHELTEQREKLRTWKQRWPLWLAGAGAWIIGGALVYAVTRSELPAMPAAVLGLGALVVGTTVGIFHLQRGDAARAWTWWTSGTLAWVFVLAGLASSAFAPWRTRSSDIGRCVKQVLWTQDAVMLGRNLNAWPSIPFYVSRDSPRPDVISADMDTVARGAQSEATLVAVLGAEERETFRKAGPTWEQHFRAFSLDHLKWVDFYVTVNLAAQQHLASPPTCEGAVP